MKMFILQLLSSVVLPIMMLGFTSHGAAVEWGPLTLSHTTKVKVHNRQAVLLSCGEKAHEGVVQCWHTPFGKFHNHISVHENQDPATMQTDGSLEINITGEHHQGLYYCLLQSGGGTTLYSYLLSMVSKEESGRALGQPQLGNSEVGQGRNTEEVELDSHDSQREDAMIPRSVFEGAVAASVLLTFALGFSVGALSRAPVLRCVGVATKKVRSLRQRDHCDTATTDHSSGVVMDTLSPAARENEAYQESQEDCASVTGRRATSPPLPAKPQRSFRREREEKAETTTYLEGCDYREGEKEEESRDSKEECNKTEVDEESKKPSQQEKETERGVEARASDSSNSAGAIDVDERKSEDKKDEGSGGEEERVPPRPARRSRVVRLYQYDDDGQRYGHLQDSASAEPVPAPRLKQRSLSRLSAIMAAAGASPLESAPKEPGEENDQQERDSPILPSSPKEKPVFSMDI